MIKGDLFEMLYFFTSEAYMQTANDFAYAMTLVFNVAMLQLCYDGNSILLMCCVCLHTVLGCY